MGDAEITLSPVAPISGTISLKVLQHNIAEVIWRKTVNKTIDSFSSESNVLGLYMKRLLPRIKV